MKQGEVAAKLEAVEGLPGRHLLAQLVAPVVLSAAQSCACTSATTSAQYCLP